MLGVRFLWASSKSPSVLDEIVGHLQLSHVMIVGSHPGQDGMGAYASAAALREVAHDDAVVVRAGGLDHQLLEAKGAPDSRARGA